MSDAHMWTADSRPRPGAYLTFMDGRGREISLHVDEPGEHQFSALLATFAQLASQDGEHRLDAGEQEQAHG